MMYLVVMAWIAISDAYRLTIPIPALALGLLLGTVAYGEKRAAVPPDAAAMLCGGIVFVLWVVLWRQRRCGAGDVVLAGMTVLRHGGRTGALVLGVASVVAAGGVVGSQMYQWRVLSVRGGSSRPARVPFAPALLIAELLVWGALLPAVATADPLAAHHVETLSIRNEPVDQVILAFAEQAGISVVTDASVDGRVSAVLHNVSGRAAIEELANAAGIFLTDRAGIIYLSRVRVVQDTGRYALHARDCEPEAIIQLLARATATSVVCEPLSMPRAELSIAAPTPSELMARTCAALGLTVEQRETGWHVADANGTDELPEQSRAGGTLAAGVSRVTTRRATPDTFTLSTSHASRAEILLAAAAAAEQTVLILSPLREGETSFSVTARDPDALYERLIRAWELIRVTDDATDMIAAAADRDRLDGYGVTATIPLSRITRETAQAVVGQHRGIRILASADPSATTETLIVRGIPDAVAAARATVASLESVASSAQLVRYEAQEVDPSHLAHLLGIEFSAVSFYVDETLGTVSAFAPQQLHTDIIRRLESLDRGHALRSLTCHTIPAPAAVATLSAAYPSVHFAVGADDRTIAARGTQGTVERAAALLALIDRAPPQLRFDVCVIQFERGEAVDHGIRGSVESTASGLAGAGAGSGATVAGAAAPVLVASSFDRVFDLDFDFVSALGYRAALAISDELSSSRARLVLDTSVRVREGETARVENSTTYRYRETPLAENGQTVSSIVREIDSGLLIELSGRLLSDRSIDVDVRISLSRNGADMTGTGNPPPTSRRVVTSRVRVFPGEPLVIGGLLQQEETQSESRFPILGRIPLLKRLINTRSQREEETELVVYLSAAPDVPTNPVLRRREQIDALRAIQASRITAERGAQTVGDGDER